MHRLRTVFVVIVFGGFASLAHGQAATPQPSNDPTAQPGADTAFETIVITASPGTTTEFRSSVSVNSISVEEVARYAPRGTAEIFRNIPGVRSEAGGGNAGNANIIVRGLPAASGGAKFLQLHEDGIPVLEFGDIAFGNADIFLRADWSVERIESIRGGSASTFASNSPGGVINFISNTGERPVSRLGYTKGLDFDWDELNFEYGGPINEKWRAHIAGYARSGEGPKDTGFTANSGYQVKANITREFDNGYIRFNFKRLDDRLCCSLAGPAVLSGTNSNPKLSSLPGYDFMDDAVQSPYLASDLYIDGAGRPSVADTRDGTRPTVTALGSEVHLDLLEGWQVTDKFRYSSTSSEFLAPFVAGAPLAQDLANQIAGITNPAVQGNASLRFYNGPRAGELVADPATLNGNGRLLDIVYFNSTVHSFDNVTNDLQLSKRFSLGDDSSFHMMFGLYTARQDIEMDWHWNGYVQEVKPHGALLDVIAPDGTVMTLGGQTGFGNGFGGCCVRRYDVSYDIEAPYAQFSYETGKLNLDASARYDQGSAVGIIAGGAQRTMDVNADGVISPPENRAFVVDNAHPSPVDYDYRYWSYSVGANYLIGDDLAAFARFSRGSRANADRLLFGPAVSMTTGGLADDNAAIDAVAQVEAGVKVRNISWVPGDLDVFATLFYTEAEENNVDITIVPLTFFNREYEAHGLELLANYAIGDFRFDGNLTYTRAEITKDFINPAVVGNTPQRLPKVLYRLTAAYAALGSDLDLGFNLIGQTDGFGDDANGVHIPGYAYVNLFANYRVSEHFSIGLNVNNAFDEIVVDNVDVGSITPGSTIVTTPRAISGRSSTLQVLFSF
jgi:outer membrane receptor protein involved in Fe transport